VLAFRVGLVLSVIVVGLGRLWSIAGYVAGGHIGFAVIPAAGAAFTGWIVVRELRRRRTGSTDAER
jgi:hypothetical protein